MITKTTILPHIFHLEADSQYELTSTFLRAQEYYESPFKEIHNQVFTLETFMDRYAKEYGNFTYTTDWSGFNIPDYSLRDFFAKFSLLDYELLEKEKKLKELLLNQLTSEKPFYVIGTYKKDHPSTIEHEIAHALYYLNEDYRYTVNAMIRHEIPTKLYYKLVKKMQDAGYGKNVIDDEIHAHLSTETVWYIKTEFNVTVPLAISKKFRKLFKTTKQNYRKCHDNS